MKKITVTMFVLLTIMLSQNLWAIPTGKIAGTVIDAETREPLPGAVITILGNSMGTNTDIDGRYAISNVKVGTYKVQARMMGYESITVTGVKVVTDLTTTVNFKLKSACIEMEGTVVKYETGAVQVRADVTSSSKTVSTKEIQNMSGIKPSEGYLGEENYGKITENNFIETKKENTSTFSIDVDPASYANVRRYLMGGQLPPSDAVRIEELVNYFIYHYPQPNDNTPFSINADITECPWNMDHQLLRIGLKGKEYPLSQLPPSNLVFLIDVSGSMQSADKLPLIKEGLKMLVRELRNKDRVAVVVYASAQGLALPSTSGDKKETILSVIDKLSAGGSTAGAAGIQLAYKTAIENFIDGGNNRVILATDGDFNVGVSNTDELIKMIEEKRKQGVYLSVLGVGTGNLQDERMEQLADKGNGNYSYIDNLNEAKRVLVNQMTGTLFAIAKDVKIQVEFNPKAIKAYRLIGYENRMLKKEDFKDDTKDAGELGVGHTVTALYELERGKIITPDAATVNLRYKDPNASQSRLTQKKVPNAVVSLSQASEDLRFAVAVAEFGLLLRNSTAKGTANFNQVKEMAEKSKGSDEDGARTEFLKLIHIADSLFQAIPQR